MSAPNGFLFSLVEDGFSVSLFCAQQVKDNASEFVRCGRDRLRPAEFAGNTAEEFTQIVFGVM